VTITAGGIGHLVFGGLGFLCLIVGCLFFGQYYAGRRRASMAWFSRATGVVYLVAFVGIASGSASPVVVLGFWAAVVLAWGWLAATAIDLYRRTPLLTPPPAR
jgi:hypothetical protein